jgi:hypothetical protein
VAAIPRCKQRALASPHPAWTRGRVDRENEMKIPALSSTSCKEQPSMGWLYMYSLDGHARPKQYLDAQFTYQRPTVTSRVLRSALLRMKVYYAAVEHVMADDQRDVWAAVCLVKYNPRDKEGLVFGYKDISEDMGPCEAECPAAILDLLTPTKSEYANEWRARCRKVIDHPPLRPGQLIKFEQAVHFNDNSQHQVMEVVAHPLKPRSLLFRPPGTQQFYRIGNIEQHTYQVMHTPDFCRPV